MMQEKKEKSFENDLIFKAFSFFCTYCLKYSYTIVK